VEKAGKLDMKIYGDRQEAGRLLAQELNKEHWDNPLILALPRGGVPVAVEVANALGEGLDVFVVRKIGAPWNPEYGIGALSETGALWLNGDALAQLALSAEDMRSIIEHERQEITRRLKRYRGARPLPSPVGRTVILVDDGLATGGTALMAVRSLKDKGAKAVVVAVPVGSVDAVALLQQEAEQVICLETPRNFYAVGQWYREFNQVTDEEVIAYLDAVQASRSSHPPIVMARSL